MDEPVTYSMRLKTLALICERAARLLQEGWTGRSYCTTYQGTPCEEISSEAAFFSLNAALVRAVCMTTDDRYVYLVPGPWDVLSETGTMRSVMRDVLGVSSVESLERHPDCDGEFLALHLKYTGFTLLGMSRVIADRRESWRKNAIIHADMEVEHDAG